jgi:putative PIN family toxin of toxin-antitoxin system
MKAKIILDTNILFSAIAFDKVVEKVLLLTTDQTGELQTYRSSATSRELVTKLSSPKFLSYRKMTLQQVKEIIEEYFQISKLVEPTQKVILSRDKDDNMFLELAHEINADYLITGDKDLLSLNSFKGTKICKPSEFIKMVIAD